MPPKKADGRKSDVSVAVDETVMSAAPEGDSQMGPAPADKKEKDATIIEDLTLPKSIITRLAKGVLPPNTQIQANAVMAMSKSATVFINYLAAHAHDNTVSANKKTLAPADVFKALDEIEFSFLKEPLEAEFAKFNQVQTEKRNNYRHKMKAKQEGGAPHDDSTIADATANTTIDADMSEVHVGGDDAPRAKKPRVDGQASEEHDDAETEDDPDVQESDDDDDAQQEEEEQEEEEEEEEEEDEGEGEGGAADETQDALEERPVVVQDRDEALDGDDSD